mgnify:CR=1 FL=1
MSKLAQEHDAILLRGLAFRTQMHVACRGFDHSTREDCVNQFLHIRKMLDGSVVIFVLGSSDYVCTCLIAFGSLFIVYLLDSYCAASILAFQRHKPYAAV